MARPLEWRRFTFSNTDFSFFGSTPGAVLEPGETEVRTRWFMQAWSVWGDLDNYPPATTLLRAGIIMQPAGIEFPDSPISQADSDWIDLVSMPWRSQIATSTGVDWLILADTGLPDRDAKAMRTNATETDQAIWLSWELLITTDLMEGFGFNVSGAMDCLVALAP